MNIENLKRLRKAVADNEYQKDIRNVDITSIHYSLAGQAYELVHGRLNYEMFCSKYPDLTQTEGDTWGKLKESMIKHLASFLEVDYEDALDLTTGNRFDKSVMVNSPMAVEMLDKWISEEKPVKLNHIRGNLPYE